jgi:hypothetical protein
MEASPSAKILSASQQWDLFSRKVLLPFSEHASLDLFFDGLHVSEIRVQEYLAFFEHHPVFLDQILRLDSLKNRITQWNEEEAKNPERKKVILERIINLLGKTPLRNLCAAVSISRATRSLLVKSKKDRPQFKASDLIKFAVKAEAFAESKSLPNHQEIFEAALVIDWLLQLIRHHKLSKEAEKYLEAQFNQSIKAGWIAHLLVSLQKKSKWDRLAFPSMFFILAGRGIQFWLFPRELDQNSYMEFSKKIEKDYAHDFRMMDECERSRFVHASTDWAALLATCFPRFAEVVPSLFYLSRATLLENTDQKELALILNLAWKISLQPGDRLILSEAEQKTLKTLKISADELEVTIARVWKK